MISTIKKTYLVSLLLIGTLTAHTAVAVTNSPAGTWEVSGSGGSGTVGDVVSVRFSVTNVRDRCADVKVRLQTLNEAREKLSFVGSGIPTSNDVSPEQVSWRGIEFENGRAQNFQANVRIDRGVVGDDIGGFEVFTYCFGKSSFRGIVDNISVKIVAKAESSTQKATSGGSLASIGDLNSIFRSVHGRNPIVSEWQYWATRLLDKGDRTALRGAMAYHKAHGRTIGGTVTKTVTSSTKQGSVAGKQSGSLASISDLNSIFRSVYGRNPSPSEWQYWANRLLDKSDRVAFKGAITYHMQNGIAH